MRERLPLPKKIQDAPELMFGLELYYAAFFDLSTCRPVGFVEGSIRWLDVDVYCDRLELDEDQRIEMHYHMERMDAVYLDWVRRNTKTKGKGGKGGSK